MAIVRTTGRAGFGTSLNDEIYGYNPTFGEGNIDDALFGFSAASLSVYGIPQIISGLSNSDLAALYTETFLEVFDGNDLLAGGEGDDLLIGGGGDDFLTGGPDSFPGLDGFQGFSQGNDTLIGGWGNDRLYGGNAVGTPARDGAPGRDNLYGGPGDDLLFGSTGADLLHGGIGKDTFSFKLLDSTAGDRIVDFNVGVAFDYSFDHASGSSFMLDRNRDVLEFQVDIPLALPKFIGSSEFTKTGQSEINYAWETIAGKPTTVVRIDSNGDGHSVGGSSPDGFIEIDGYHLLRQNSIGQIYGYEQNPFAVVSSDPVIVFLDFDSPATRPFYTGAAYDGSLLLNYKSGLAGGLLGAVSPLAGDLVARQEITALVQDIFDRSGIPVFVTSLDPAGVVEKSLTTVLYSKTDTSIYHNTLGIYLAGPNNPDIDRFDMLNDDTVHVFQDQENYELFKIANTTAHEVGHAFGMRHINPLSSTEEVEDYQDGAAERFYDNPANIVEAPIDPPASVENASTTGRIIFEATHNPKFHLLAFGMGYGQSQVQSALGLSAGTWDNPDVSLAETSYSFKLELDAAVELQKVVLVSPGSYQRGGSLNVVEEVELSEGDQIFKLNVGPLEPYQLLAFDASGSGVANYVLGYFSGDEIVTIIKSPQEFSLITTVYRANGGLLTAVGSVDPMADNGTSSLALSGPVHLAEGNGEPTNFNYAVTRSGDTDGASSVKYTVAGSGVNFANGVDFVGGALPTGTISFAAGEVTKTIVVQVAGDTSVESDEEFTVTLSGATGNADIETATALGTILNDDALLPPSLALSGPITLAEGNGGSTEFIYTVTRTGDTADATNVAWRVVTVIANSATASDFVGGVLPQGVTYFDPGESVSTITVSVAGDLVAERSESFTLIISSATAITSSNAKGTISNDDNTVNTYSNVNLVGDVLTPTIKTGFNYRDLGSVVNAHEIRVAASKQEVALFDFTNEALSDFSSSNVTGPIISWSTTSANIDGAGGFSGFVEDTLWVSEGHASIGEGAPEATRSAEDVRLTWARAVGVDLGGSIASPALVSPGGHVAAREVFNDDAINEVTVNYGSGLLTSRGDIDGRSNVAVSDATSLMTGSTRPNIRTYEWQFGDGKLTASGDDHVSGWDREYGYIDYAYLHSSPEYKGMTIAKDVQPAGAPLWVAASDKGLVTALAEFAAESLVFA